MLVFIIHVTFPEIGAIVIGVVQTINNFIHRKVSVVLRAPLEISVVFPAVTVCNMNSFRKDDLRDIEFCIPEGLFEVQYTTWIIS